MNEFLIINKYLKSLSLKNEGSLQLKDDIYYNSQNGLAISLDTYVEGVHFLNSKDPNKFLKKIFRSSLSDLYCKGIKPKTYFLSLAINKKIINHRWFSKFKKILKDEQKKFSVSLGGGDTTYSSKLVITFAIIGFSKNKPVFRHSCKLFDDIYVTGDIGDSYMGLKVIKKEYNFGKLNNFFIKKYFEPNLQNKFSVFLKKIASSSVDISDGLGLNLRHLFGESNFGAFINLNLLPLSKNCKSVLKNNKISIKKIFSKGDDYQILFTSKRKYRNKISALSKKLNIKISRIGFVNKSKSIIFKINKNKFTLNIKKLGYTHDF